MRIFVADLVAGERVIRGDEHHYLAHVRRARSGDRIQLFDGAGHHAAATITRIADDATTVTVEAPEEIAAKPPHVRALVPLIKGDRMDTCLEKLVEVGVDSIVVWPAARSVVRIDPEKREARVVKYQAALQAAARQSGRAQIPGVKIVESLAEALAHGELVAARTSARFVLDPTSDAPFTGSDVDEVTIASGPEGGFTAGELSQLANAGFASVSFGPRILRAETAPVVAVAVIRTLTRS